ncbi:hypothetical protein BKA81DRAFT_401864 [Phyllosticta paracitricarpa]
MPGVTSERQRSSEAKSHLVEAIDKIEAFVSPFIDARELLDTAEADHAAAVKAHAKARHEARATDEEATRMKPARTTLADCVNNSEVSPRMRNIAANGQDALNDIEEAVRAAFNLERLKKAEEDSAHKVIQERKRKLEQEMWTEEESDSMRRLFGTLADVLGEEVAQASLSNEKRRKTSK